MTQAVKYVFMTRSAYETEETHEPIEIIKCLVGTRLVHGSDILLQCWIQEPVCLCAKCRPSVSLAIYRG